MFRALIISCLSLITFLTLPSGALAQSAMPEYRYVLSRDTDFYGADLDALFETDFASCVRACNANAACQAFTYNSKSRACFPKQAVTDRSGYIGAFSAQKLRNDPNMLRAAEGLRAAAPFLSDRDISRAAAAARDIGLRHSAGQRTLQDMLEAAQNRRAAGNLVQAMAWTGAAVSVADRSDLWAEYGRLLLEIRTDKSSDRRKYRQRAIHAGINAYLRGQSPGARASGLDLLARAYEKAGRGRDMIPALRLALNEQPRQDLEDALDAAIGKYGFRVADSTVQSDSVTPRICGEFSERLVKSGVDYEPFVRVDAPGIAVLAEDRQLCLVGVQHGQRYRVTFREGLPAASGERLAKDVNVSLYVRDRSPAVRFPGRSYVLPKLADAALPVETVNLTELDLRLRRVSDRNLLRAVQDGYFGRPLSQWQDEEFAKNIAEEVWTGTAQVQTNLNQDVTTRLPLGEAIAGQPAGIYALSARVPGVDAYDDPGATQWFVLSDLGLSSLSGTDGLHVTVRGLSDAQPRAGVEVTLVSRANAVLGKAQTDESGHVPFDPGPPRGPAGPAPV